MIIGQAKCGLAGAPSSRMCLSFRPTNRRLPSLDERRSTTMVRFIELCCSFLLAFLVISLVSFFTLRPELLEVRAEAAKSWDDFVRAVGRRNDLVPGLVEAVKGFEPGHAKMLERLLEARSISSRVTDPNAVVASVDDMERYLIQIEKLARSRPDLATYPPFAAQWESVLKSGRGVAFARMSHYTNSRLYNRLLDPFPQNLLAALFGFVPLNEYPMVPMAGEGLR